MRGLSIPALIIVLVLVASTARGDKEGESFPVTGDIEQRVQFWIDVFTKYSIYEKIIHDSDKPELVYRVIDFRDYFKNGIGSKSSKAQIVQEERVKIVAILKKLAQEEPSSRKFSDEELKIYRLFGNNPKKKDLLHAAYRVRTQGGGKEVFRESIIRSGMYISEIERIFAEHRLPEELVWLPHVESSFNPNAYSRSGAVGLWQFTRTTGNRFLTIRVELDERRDPFISSRAAARLLKSHYKALGTWPLAITAYNHGLSGVRNAVRKLKTRDLGKIIGMYKSRRFGFASKNFYAEFLAAVEVAQNPELYFGKIDLEPPVRFRTLEVVEPYGIDSVLKAFKLTEEELKEYNPAIRPSVYRQGKKIPVGCSLRLPLEKEKETVIGVYAGRGDQDGFRSGFPSLILSRMGCLGSQSAYTIWSWLQVSLEIEGAKLLVLPEETLGHYADWLEIPTWNLREINGLRYGQKIRAGQNLSLCFDRVSAEMFMERRLTFHREILEDFFRRYQIVGFNSHRVSSGETLWTLARQSSDIPFWLLVAYNGERSLSRILQGETVSIPLLERVF